MIVALRRDGTAASLSAIRKRAIVLVNQPSRNPSRSCRTHPSIQLSSRFQRLPMSVVCSGRMYSTSLPDSDKKAANASSDPVLHGQQRMRKVDLRPGPVKPPATSSTDTAGPSRLPGTSSSRAPAHTKPTVSSNSSSALDHESILSATQHDMETAAKHGILAPPPPNAGRIGTLFHQAKELFKFYWRGLKLINTNRKRVNEMQDRVKNGGLPLTRWEYQFIRTYREDALKLIPFALIIIIAEEVIPLVVLYAPGILPSTCILPAQQERIANNRREKQRAYASSTKEIFQRIEQLGKSSPGIETKQLLDGPALVAVSGVLGHSKYSFNPLRLHRIRRHLAAVGEDDALLHREEMGSRLNPAELLVALGERGIVTEGLSVQQQRSRLRWWLMQVEGPSQSEPQSYPSDPVARRLVLISRSVVGHY